MNGDTSLIPLSKGKDNGKTKWTDNSCINPNSLWKSKESLTKRQFVFHTHPTPVCEFNNKKIIFNFTSLLSDSCEKTFFLNFFKVFL